MSGKANTLQDTFERNTLMALHHAHRMSTAHDIFSPLPGVVQLCSTCPCCIHLKAMDEALTIEAPEFTDEDLDKMGRLLLIEHDFASRHAAAVIKAHCPAYTQRCGMWYNEKARRSGSEAIVGDAIELLEHRKALQRHPTLSHLVRPLEH